ncbi:hypothetical protein P3T76_006636 [Phytophthora citrophthora]|uniref:Uncharacterized protein n=1 Tax=Phytophthora citrophthora TaxID=4793 RepID=A0AAD9GP10_9STRA|nr:hypothetical protein P3T76_006636 [Phytophthora citrophthora]
MEGESEGLGQKRAPLSTVSLDSSYDNTDGDSAVEKRSASNACSWVVLMGLILVAVGLVLALDRTSQQSVVDEGSPVVSTSHSSLTSGEDLTASQKKLVEWLKQMSNASELYVEGDGSNFSLDGVLFPRDNEDTWLPFDAALVVRSGVTLPSRQFVVLANGRGFKWVMTSMGYGDVIVTAECLTANQSLPFDKLDSTVATANWTDSDKSEVNVVFNGENYTVSNDDGSYDFSSTEDTHCWLIGGEGGDLDLRICIPSVDGLFPKTEFTELFNAVSGCPELARKSARSRISMMSVPLPLRKWYASYKA